MATPASDSVTRAIDPALIRAKARVGCMLREKWRLDALLGVGGMAAVYAGTHRNGTRAAVKILHPELSTIAHVRSRFLKEGYVANRIDHSGSVRVIDDDVAEDGSLYLVMDLLDGESLEDRRTRLGGRLDADEVLAAADQLLDVLAAAHDKGIVHRDIKPENVFLTRDGVIKVLDFGIARLRELSTASSATRTGTTMGTPAFMAPEHARGLWDEVDARSDLWSVGAMMFSLLSGRLVHEGRTVNEILLGAMSRPAPGLASVLPETPAQVAAVIDRALAYEKKQRWPDARGMQDAVRRAFHGLHGAPISTHPRLTVPATVPNRTLPSADAALPLVGTGGTGPAVASGKTGVPLRSSSSVAASRGLLVVGGVTVGAIVVVLLVVAIGLAASHKQAPTTALGSPSAAPVVASSAVAPASDPVRATAVPAPNSASGTPVLTLEDLPRASPGNKRALGITKSDAGVHAEVVPQSEADWKEKRK